MSEPFEKIVSCPHCKRDDIVMCIGMPLVPTGFMLYDSTQDKDVPDLDCCHEFMCPMEKRTSYYSRMLHPMGSMGEEAHDYDPEWANWKEGDPLPF